MNHFVGVGANYDVFPGMHPAFAAEGKPTTDTTDPLALRFGALAGTFAANPTATDWFLIGSGGQWLIPNGASNLQIRHCGHVLLEQYRRLHDLTGYRP